MTKPLNASGRIKPMEVYYMKLARTICFVLGFMLIGNFAFSQEQKWDFKKGAPYDFEISNGWSNHDMFNVTWRRSNVTFNKGKMQLAIDFDDKEKQISGIPYSGGEFRSTKSFKYGRYEVSMKAMKNDGVVSSFFTYTGPFENQPWDEIDVEILGKDTTKVQFNYFTNGVGGNEYMHDLGFDASKGFHTYAFEWYADEIVWFVDGKEVHSANVDIPTHKSRIFMNAWCGINRSDINAWLNPFNDKKLPIMAEYEWIKYTPFKGDKPTRGNKKPDAQKASADFAKYKSENGSFALDKSFTTVSNKALSKNTMNKNSSNWYALALSEFEGAATVAVEDGACHFTIQKPGKEIHSVQLLQHLGVAQGYTYKISFEAKAAKPRNIAVKLGGDDDNGWAVYSDQYSPKLTSEYQKFEYTFTMKRKSDASARLEFNMGTNANDVWIKNVTLTVVE